MEANKTKIVELTSDEVNLIMEALSCLDDSRSDELRWALAGNESRLAEADQNCINAIEALQEKLSSVDTMTYREFLDKFGPQIDALECFNANGEEISDEDEIPDDTPVIRFGRMSGWFSVELDME